MHKEVKTAADGRGTVALSGLGRLLREGGEALGVECALEYTELERGCKQISWVTGTRRSERSPFDSGVAAGGNGAEELELREGEDSEAVAGAVRRLGYDLSPEDQARVYEEFCRLSARKSVGSRELEALVASTALQVPPTYKLVNYVVSASNVLSASAHVTLEKAGEKLQGLCLGDGPIDAAFLAIEQIAGHHYELDDFQIQAVTEGREAMGSALVKLRWSGRLYSGSGISTDILGASIAAYLNALNKIAYEEV